MGTPFEFLSQPPYPGLIFAPSPVLRNAVSDSMTKSSLPFTIKRNENGLYHGANYSGGTALTNFRISSMVTLIN